MKSAYTLTVVLVVLCVSAGAAFAQSMPQTISFQGKLTDSSGNAVTSPVDVRFRLYTAGSGGTHVWEEVHGNVTPDGNGLYNVLLGSGTVLNLPFDVAYYLEVAVAASGTGSYETLSPRYPLAASPYAFRAGGLAGLTATTAEINQALQGKGASVTAANLTTLTNGSDATGLHGHSASDMVSTTGLDADQVDGYDAYGTVQTGGNHLLALDASGMYPVSVIPQGTGSTLDADTVDGYHAAGTPMANDLLALNASAKFPNSALYTGSGGGLDADLLDGNHATAFSVTSHDHWGQSWSNAGTYALQLFNGGSTSTAYGLYSYVNRLSSCGNVYGMYGSVSGNSSADTSSSYGGYFFAPSNILNGTRVGVSGTAYGSSSMGYYNTTGVEGYSYDSYDYGYGGYFYATRNSGNMTVYPVWGIRAYANVSSANTNTIYGAEVQANAPSGHSGAAMALRTFVNNLSPSSYGLYSYLSGGGNFGGYFYGNVYVSGTFGCSGTKSFVQSHPTDASKEIVYVCAEGPEAMVFCRGTAVLVEGRVEIALPEDFRLVAAEQGLRVQLTPRSLDSKGLAAYEISRDRVAVGELGAGTGTYEFDWMVTGVRAGYENHQAVQPTVHNLPERFPSIEELEFYYAQEHNARERALLVSNGVLNADGTLNRAKVLSLGWKLPPETMERHRPEGVEEGD